MTRIKGLRWWIIALVCLGTIMNYIARNSLGALAPQLKTDLGISTQQYSYIAGAFQAAYTVMQPVCGMIIDFVGLKAGFAIFAVLWSIANMLHGAASGWLSLAFFRGLLGLTEAAAIPSGIKAVSEWFPHKEKSVAIGFFNAGTSLGALIAPPAAIFLSLRYGWQVAFAATGAIGFIFAGLWWAFYRAPEEHPNITDEERAFIVKGRPSVVGERKTVMEILSLKRFWAVAIPRFLAEPAWQTFSVWIPLYLATERHMDIKQIALFAWLPFLAADLGGICGGYLSPFCMKYLKLDLIPSRAAGVVLGAVLMVGPGLVGLATDAYTAIGLFCIGGFAHQMISALVNTLSADVFAPAEVGTANGLTGTAAWTGGFLFTLVVGALADTVGWAPLFACLTVFDLLGATVLIALMRGERPQGVPVAA